MENKKVVHYCLFFLSDVIGYVFCIFFYDVTDFSLQIVCVFAWPGRVSFLDLFFFFIFDTEFVIALDFFSFINRLYYFGRKRSLV